MRFNYYGLSDIGKVRHRNEDYWLADLETQLFVVADGMGGRSGGDVASKEAVKHLVKLLYENNSLRLRDNDIYKRHLYQIFSKVNGFVYQKSQEKIDLKGMGTTLSFIQFRNKIASVVHVGDSRVYCLRRGILYRLTEDHSLANRLSCLYGLPKESEKVYPYRNILTNSVGCRPYIRPDLREMLCQEKDLFCLCSDGLTNSITEKDMYNILNEDSSLEAKGKSLVSLANVRGGNDNITVVLVQLN